MKISTISLIRVIPSVPTSSRRPKNGLTKAAPAFAAITNNELLAQRDNVSAVNSDEELIKLIQFQRAYQAASVDALASIAPDSVINELHRRQRAQYGSAALSARVI